MKRYLTSVICAILTFITGCATLPEHYVSLHNGSTEAFDTILLEVRDARVILVGEGHESEEDHLVQFEVIRRLHENGTTIAIALEMFPADTQGILDRWLSGSLPEDNFERAYRRIWHVPYGYYAKIFDYAREKGIPLVAANANRALIESVGKKGLQVLSEEFRKEIGVTPCAESPEYERLMRLVDPGIGHGGQLPFFCEAQLVRDSIMAYHTARILKGGVRTVVALVGSAHALKGALPAILQRHYGLSCRVLMSRAFVEIISREPDSGLADYIWY